MVQRDYLLRQIEKMGVILAGIRGKIGGEPVEAMMELRLLAARAGVELEFLDLLAVDSLLDILGEDNLEKLYPAAEVLALKGEIEERLGETEKSLASFEKASVVVRRLQELISPDGEAVLYSRLRALVDRLAERGVNGGHGADHQ